MLDSHVSLQNDWGNKDLLSSNLLGSGWDTLYAIDNQGAASSSNVFGNDRFPAATASTGLFQTHHAPATGPPGLLPNKALQGQAVPLPPPGLGMGSASKEPPAQAESQLPTPPQSGSNFLAYLNKTGNPTSNSNSWKT